MCMAMHNQKIATKINNEKNALVKYRTQSNRVWTIFFFKQINERKIRELECRSSIRILFIYHNHQVTVKHVIKI